MVNLRAHALFFGDGLVAQYSFTRTLKGLGRLVDISGWQKWFGAAVLGFAFVLDLKSDFSLLQLQGLVIGIASVLCYIQSLNDYFDVEIDERKEEIMGKELIVSKMISKKAALAVILSVLLIGVVSAWITSIDLFALVLAAAFLGTIYSAPPLRLKMKYPFSTLVQFASCFLPFLGGVASISNVTFQAIIVSSIFAVLTIIHRFVHEIGNYKADLLTGKETVAVVKGLGTAWNLCILSAILGLTEFMVFFVLGWFSTVFVFLFIIYLIICIVPWAWLRYMPRPLRKFFIPIVMVSGFILLFIVLLLYGKV